MLGVVLGIEDLLCCFLLSLFGFVFEFWVVSCSLCLLACLSSFTDWCIVHKQQSRVEDLLDLRAS